MPAEVSNADPDSPEAQRKLLETIVGDLPAFKESVDTGQGMFAPEGQEAQAFYDTFNPKQAKQPAEQPVSGQPVSTQTQPQPVAQPQPAAAPAPAPQSSSGRLFAGKYRSVEEMERGYNEAQAELKRRNEENVVLKAAQLATERIGGFRRERDEPPVAPPSEIPIQFRGDQPVVPVNDLRNELLQAARQAAQETISGILTPMQQLGSANANLRASYPEFAQREGEFANWLRDNPGYQELIQHNPEVGLESAYLKYSRVSGVQQATQATQATHAAQQQVDSARQQAAPAGNIAPSTRRPNETESKQAHVQQLFKRWQETGDPADKKRYMNAHTEWSLGEQFVNTLERTSWGRG